MEIANISLIEKIEKLCAKYVMPLMLVSFFLYNTVINDWLGGKVETLQNVLAIIIIGVVAINILSKPLERIPAWLKSNVIIVLYLLARLATLVMCDFDYSVIRTIFFETFFLVGITSYTIGNGRQDLYVKIFVALELLISGASLLLYYTMPILGTEDILMQWTNLELQGNALLFGNTNTAGIMAGFSVLLAIIYYKKNVFPAKLVILFGLYNVVAMVLFGCRSADLGLIAALVALILVSKLSFVTGRRIVILSMICSIAILIPTYLFANSMISVERFGYSEVEDQINDLSTGRYIIWKECIMTQEDDMVLGIGSLKLEQEQRKALVENIDQDYYWRYVDASKLGPHNGYIGMISCTGLVGFALFIGALLKKILSSSNVNSDKWYLLLVFIFVINCFESLFILNRFFTCFFMFMILEGDFAKKESGEGLLAGGHK